MRGKKPGPREDATFPFEIASQGRLNMTFRIYPSQYSNTSVICWVPWDAWDSLEAYSVRALQARRSADRTMLTLAGITLLGAILRDLSIGGYMLVFGGICLALSYSEWAQARRRCDRATAYLLLRAQLGTDEVPLTELVGAVEGAEAKAKLLRELALKNASPSP